jgi:hypothetical protein
MRDRGGPEASTVYSKRGLHISSSTIVVLICLANKVSCQVEDPEID